MSTPILGWPERQDTDDVAPVSDLQTSPTEPLALADETVDQLAAGSADVIIVSTAVPIEVPVPVPVPVEPGQPWMGMIIDAVPTTADEVAAVVLSVPDVVRLHAGRFGEVATYLPGRRVTGVKIGDELIEVHVVVAGQAPIQRTAPAVHAAVATVAGTPVHVFVEDIAARHNAWLGGPKLGPPQPSFRPASPASSPGGRIPIRCIPCLRPPPACSPD